MICNDINLIILLSIGIGASLYLWCNQHNVMYLPVYSPWFDTSQITDKSCRRSPQKWVEFRILIVRLSCICVDCCFCSDCIIISWSDKKMQMFENIYISMAISTSSFLRQIWSKLWFSYNCIFDGRVSNRFAVIEVEPRRFKRVFASIPSGSSIFAELELSIFLDWSPPLKYCNLSDMITSISFFDFQNSKYNDYKQNSINQPQNIQVLQNHEVTYSLKS